MGKRVCSTKLPYEKRLELALLALCDMIEAGIEYPVAHIAAVERYRIDGEDLTREYDAL